MKVAVFSVTEEGKKLGEKLCLDFSHATLFHCPGKGNLKLRVKENFTPHQGLVFIMAAGIVVRMIAPLIRNKHRDPAVVAVDDFARYAVSLLSGHEGGANRLTYRVASVLGSAPVITTGTETQKTVVVGVGCRKNVTSAEIEHAVTSALEMAGVNLDQVRVTATAKAKYGESGLKEAMENLKLPLVYIEHDRINLVGKEHISESLSSEKHLGLRAVAEPCALLAAKNGGFLLRKCVIGPVTIALVREKNSITDK
ncbi:MAG: cobalamin biosynthesis protein CbiG [Spirochaetes bacterium]|nr:MAG: cobalamin biosynthesis protein CbiG [Spirochaetota bacterium]